MTAEQAPAKPLTIPLQTVAEFADALETIGIEEREPPGYEKGLRHAAHQLRLLTAGMTEYMDHRYLLAMAERAQRTREAEAHARS